MVFQVHATIGNYGLGHFRSLHDGVDALNVSLDIGVIQRHECCLFSAQYIIDVFVSADLIEGHVVYILLIHTLSAGREVFSQPICSGTRIGLEVLGL